MIIYKITTTETDGVYIGQTVNAIEKRFQRHIRDAMSGTLDTHLARAIRLYGPETFSIEQIDSANTKQELDEKEKYWIEFYNSCSQGFNETVGGDGGNTYANKTFEEMDQIKEKIRQTKMGGKNPHSEKIKCKNVVTNEELIFDSMADGKRYFNQPNHQFISRRCRREVKNLWNKQWMFAYLDNPYAETEYTLEPGTGKATKISVVNLLDNTTTTFNSFSAAERFFGVPQKSFSRPRLKLPKDTCEYIVKNQYKIIILS